MQEAAEAAIGALSVISQELSLLKRHIVHSRRAQRDAEHRGGDSRSGGRAGVGDDDRQRAPSKGLQLTHISRRPGAAAPPAVPFGMGGGMGGSRSGAVATYDSAGAAGYPHGGAAVGVDSGLEVRRETLLGGVFQPDHNMPTMSLEEFADQEVRFPFSWRRCVSVCVCIYVCMCLSNWTETVCQLSVKLDRN